MSVKDREDIFNECCLLRSMCLQVLDRAKQLDDWDNSATSAEILDAAEYLVRRVTERRGELAREWAYEDEVDTTLEIEK